MIMKYNQMVQFSEGNQIPWQVPIRNKPSLGTYIFVVIITHAMIKEILKISDLYWSWWTYSKVQSSNLYLLLLARVHTINITYKNSTNKFNLESKSGPTLGIRQRKQLRPAFGILLSVILWQTPAPHEHTGGLIFSPFETSSHHLKNRHLLSYKRWQRKRKKIENPIIPRSKSMEIEKAVLI